jgi:ABC-2 type transport system ATP-binding protein
MLVYEGNCELRIGYCVIVFINNAMSQNNIAIDVKNLNKSFAGKAAVINASLQVKQGEIFGFLGPNGSGKTTTIRMLCGLLTPDSGVGTCLGFDILKESAKIKQYAGYMTQHFSLYDELTVYENLNFIATLYNVPHGKQVIQEMIANLELSDRAHQLVGTLSGGWKQRLSLSAALLHSPRLLLLDEPTAGVDPKARREFWDQIHMLAEKGVTTLVSTHYMDEAERCHRLGYIFQGKILIQGTKEEVIANSSLNTWLLSGGDLKTLASEIKNYPGVEQVAYFGDSLHVSGVNAEALHASVMMLQKNNHQCLQMQPSLEDVFIYYSRIR